MKKLLLLLAMTFTFSATSFAQNNVKLNIYHKLGEADFSSSTTGTNNLGDVFTADRMEYYISEISITHDGGTVTNIDDTWILVDANEATSVELGSYPIDEVENIAFHIGVDEAHNHLDPASFAADHPLAPKAPSMHWGWVAGYRFIAMEGFGGSSNNQTIELHGLGDVNYFQTNVAVSSTASNNAVTIHLNADYERGLENVAVNSGVIVHGDNAEAKTLIENFRDYVFSEATEITSTVDFSEVNKVEVYPNPTKNASSLLISSNENGIYQVSITDVLGRQIQYFDEVQANVVLDFEINQSGLYIISLIKEGQAVITKKLTVQ